MHKQSYIEQRFNIYMKVVDVQNFSFAKKLLTSINTAITFINNEILFNTQPRGVQFSPSNFHAGDLNVKRFIKVFPYIQITLHHPILAGWSVKISLITKHYKKQISLIYLQNDYLDLLIKYERAGSIVVSNVCYLFTCCHHHSFVL